ncbi:hypothetical protein C2S52_012323 [Perilla frutescens var. hirtella]|nr:hypothetical protein C2S52_012323 [Perilla frutescens var. hirtella]
MVVVLASPNKRYTEMINRDDLGHTPMQLQSFSKGVPIADTSNASDDNEPPCVRNDCDLIWVNGANLEFDVDFNKPLQSYIGLLARDHVKISIKNWKLIPDDMKDLIWAQVKTSYNVPETWKASCLESANSKWQTWKCRTHKDCILPNKDNPDELYKPPVDSGMLDHDWRVFVHSRVSTQFQDEYIRKKEERKLHLEGCSSDLLSLSLDKPEHVGRVRGKGSGIKPKSYFQSTRESRRATNQGSQALCNAELEEAKRKIEKQAGQINCPSRIIKGKMEKFESKHAKIDKESEGLTSCSVIKVASQEKHNMKSLDAVCIGKSDFLQGKAMKLLYGVSKKLVAYGTVFVAGAILHGSPMPPDCFRVSIDEVIDENVVLLIGPYFPKFSG